VMERLYERVLATDPTNLRALIGRATARAWQGRHAAAQADYHSVLKRRPNDLAALTGLAYSLAWSQRFFQAEQIFKRAQLRAPDNLGVRKGLAYTYLWSKQYAKALDAFTRIAEEYLDDPEPRVAIGSAHLEQGQARRSTDAFRQALLLVPDSADAVEGLRAARNLPALAQMQAWVGNTSGGGDTGLRLVEIASWLNDRTRVHVKYDNSLSLDNIELDIDARSVTLANGDSTRLTAIEFRLLRYLMLNPGKILSKSELSEHVYEEEQIKDSNVIEVYINRLRFILGKDRITTHRGQGYRLSV